MDLKKVVEQALTRAKQDLTTHETVCIVVNHDKPIVKLYSDEKLSNKRQAIRFLKYLSGFPELSYLSDINTRNKVFIINHENYENILHDNHLALLYLDDTYPSINCFRY